MGKPIAGRGQYPFNVGGILTNGAKVDGQDYIKSLYIYKQRSYNYYDLIDDNGIIYEFMELVYRNDEGYILDYYDIDINLTSSLKEKTFYIKEQDPARGIYGFSTLYQYNKIKINDGSYIFRKSDEIDYSLLAVKLTPNDIVLSVGQTVNVNASYIPQDYEKNNGTWSFSNSSCVITNAEDEQGNLTITGNRVGFTTAAFTPADNDTLTAIVLVRVVEAEVELNSIVGIVDDERTYPAYMLGEEFTLQLITEPFDFELPEPDISGIDSKYFDLINISDDKKRYTFKVISDEGAEPYSNTNTKLRFPPPNITFTVDDKIYNISQYTFYVQIVTKTEVPSFTVTGDRNIEYGKPYTYTATYDKNKYFYNPENPPVWKIFTVTANGDGTLTPISDLVAEYTAPPAPNAWRYIGVEYKNSTSKVIVWFYNMLPYAYIDPIDTIVVHEGDVIQLTPKFIPDDYPIDSRNNFRWSSYEEVYKDFGTLTTDGLLTIFDNVERNIELRPQYSYFSNGSSFSTTKYMALIKEETLPTSLTLSPSSIGINPVGKEVTLSANLLPRVNSYRKLSFEFDNPDVVEFDEFEINNQLNATWGGGNPPVFSFKGKAGGITNLKVFCTDMPEMNVSIKLFFY